MTGKSNDGTQIYDVVHDEYRLQQGMRQSGTQVYDRPYELSHQDTESYVNSQIVAKRKCVCRQVNLKS